MLFSNQTLAITTADPAYRPHALDAFIYNIAAWSHPQTGKLMFYSNGQQVFMSNHQPMQNGTLQFSARRVVILPDPHDSLLFTLVYVVQSTELRYATINMRYGNGAGIVVEKDKVLATDVDPRFVVVKQLYDYGYWIITHSWSGTAFHAFRVNGSVPDPTPVVSDTGPRRVQDASDSYLGDMSASPDGQTIAYTFRNLSGESVVALYQLDKRCGQLAFLNQVRTPYESVAFDHTSTYLYVTRMSAIGRAQVAQYEYRAADIESTQSIVLDGDPGDPMETIRLAPDNKLYITTQAITGGPSGGLSPASTLHVIQQPWLKGVAANGRIKSVQLNVPGKKCSGGLMDCQITSVLPDQIADYNSQQSPQFSRPVLSSTGTCIGDQFNMRADMTNIFTDSFMWIPAIGDTTRSLQVSRAWTSAGTYKPRFVWYLCGHQYADTLTIRVGEKPTAVLPEDTTLCAGANIRLEPLPAVERYEWSNGSTMPYLDVTTPGTYQVTLFNGGCQKNTSVTISYHPAIWLALGDEYTICDDAQELVKLDAGEGFNTYKWNPTGDTTQWIVVGDLGPYFVIVNDYRGCRGEDGTVVKRRCPVAVFVPSAFTPNNDGINDTWKPLGKDVTAMHTEVWNRWGQKVFDSQAVSPEWDGKEAMIDTYLYTITYSGFKNKKPITLRTKGTFTLIR